MTAKQISIGRDAAIAMADTEWWKDKTPQEIVRLQLFISELCMPFGDFHGAIEKALGRPVWTHEFASIDRLISEFLGDARAPTFEEICELILAEKRILLVVGKP